MSKQVTFICPECHSEEISDSETYGKEWRRCICGQEWWTDIDYSKMKNKDEE